MSEMPLHANGAFATASTPRSPVAGWAATLARPGGFRSDPRFGLADVAEPAPEPVAEEPAAAPPPDPVALAFTEGFSAGIDQARAEAAAQAEADAAARAALELSFGRLDRALEEELRLRLRDTVAALCEHAIAPLAFDGDLLTRRIEKAAAMLARADDERVIRLHPADLAMVSDRLLREWTVEPDATLDRGAIRVEGANGGVEDGPATWRRAIAEALHQA